MIDLTGYLLKDAKKLLIENGFKNINITKTTSPRNANLMVDEETARVVRLQEVDEYTVNVLVCI